MCDLGAVWRAHNRPSLPVTAALCGLSVTKTMIRPPHTAGISPCDVPGAVPQAHAAMQQANKHQRRPWWPHARRRCHLERLERTTAPVLFELREWGRRTGMHRQQRGGAAAGARLPEEAAAVAEFERRVRVLVGEGEGEISRAVALFRPSALRFC